MSDRSHSFQSQARPTLCLSQPRYEISDPIRAIEGVVLHFDFGNRPDAFVREQMHRFMDDIAPAFGDHSGA
jgi:hypothetical protein